MRRRSMLGKAAAGALGLVALESSGSEARAEDERAGAPTRSEAGAPGPRPRARSIKITKLETFLVKPRWLFLKVHTDAGHRRASASRSSKAARSPCATAVKEIEPYLVGKDPRRVVHHWQAIYRHAFYRGGPILTSALSGIDMALWDIKGKALGVPGLRAARRADARPQSASTRTPARPKLIRERNGRRASPRSRPGPRAERPLARYVETPAQVAVRRRAVRRAARRPCGDDVRHRHRLPRRRQPGHGQAADQGAGAVPADVHRGAVNCQNHDVMAEIARGTHLPIATGERVFTKWGFREVLEKQAATILQPDLCHAGGITEVRLIAGMAEAYYAAIAPAQSARARSRWPPACRSPRRSRTSSARSRSASARAISRSPFKVRERLSGPAHRPRPGHRAGRGRHGRQDRPRLAEPGELRRGRRLGRGLVSRGPEDPLPPLTP